MNACVRNLGYQDSNEETSFRLKTHRWYPREYALDSNPLLWPSRIRRMRLIRTRQYSAIISQLEKRMPTAMWAEPSFVACATWLETIAAASIVSIQKSHKFCRAIPMIVRRSERMIRDIPSR